MNIALLGFGTVGSHFYKLAEEHGELNVTAVLSRRPRPELTCTVTSDYDEIMRDQSIDTVVELIGGDEPAYSYVTAAMRAGKNVVTANKLLVCAHYDELLELAKESGVSLRCTAAAGGGIPWLTSLARAAEMDRVTAVEGILNGTTNYILSSMTAEGASYDEALARAQELGIAEADPTADVEGYDARRKLVLSANLAFGVSLREEDVPCIGITQIGKQEIRLAKSRGLTWKLIARAERCGDKVSAYVCPTLFPDATAEAHTDAAANLVSLYSERIGKQSFAGSGAGGYPTASSVLFDCLSVLRGCGSYYTDRHEPCEVDNDGAPTGWLLRSESGFMQAEKSAGEAFAAFAERKAGDSSTPLLARLAGGAKW
ncbi:MAG: homoserine dehydrogenase [Ruminococcaceae bacterium]|nr:homoserine dehydrogenase [Oscillospiraceae bacterium]